MKLVSRPQVSASTRKLGFGLNYMMRMNCGMVCRLNTHLAIKNGVYFQVVLENDSKQTCTHFYLLELDIMESR